MLAASNAMMHNINSNSRKDEQLDNSYVAATPATCDTATADDMVVGMGGITTLLYLIYSMNDNIE